VLFFEKHEQLKVGVKTNREKRKVKKKILNFCSFFACFLDFGML